MRKIMLTAILILCSCNAKLGPDVLHDEDFDDQPDWALPTLVPDTSENVQNEVNIDDAIIRNHAHCLDRCEAAWRLARAKCPGGEGYRACLEVAGRFVLRCRYECDQSEDQARGR